MPVLSKDDLKALDMMVRQTCFIHQLQLRSFTDHIDFHSSRKNSLGYEDYRRNAIIALLDAEGAAEKYARGELEKRRPEFSLEYEHDLNKRIRSYDRSHKRQPRIELEKEYYEYSVMESFVAQHRQWLKDIKDFSSKFTKQIKKPLKFFEGALKDAAKSERLNLAKETGVALESEFTSVIGTGVNAIYAIDRTEAEIAEDEVIDVTLME